MYEEIVFKNNYVQVYNEIIGEGAPVICIHGFHLDCRVMKGCLEPVFNDIEGFRRIYFDLAGMGRTASPPGLSSSDDIFEIVCAFINKILPGEEPFILIGESYGGYLARAVINKMRGRVRGVFLLAPVILPLPSTRVLPEHAVFERETGFIEKLDFFDRTVFESNIVIQTYGVWRLFKQQVIEAMNLANVAVLNAIWNNSYPLSFDVDSFDKPFEGASFALCGKNDSIAGYKDALKLFDNFSSLSYAALDRCGHYLQIERPEIFAACVIDWLKRIK